MSELSNITSSTTHLFWKVNERCLCYHGPLIYEAKILKIRAENAETVEAGPSFFVHYKGWKQTWDEWVPESRVLKFDEAGLAKQKALIAQGQAASATSSKITAGKASGSGRERESLSGIGTRAGIRKEGARGTKRAREDDDNARRSEMKLTVPEVLKVMLVDDWEFITKNHQLVTLPRSPTAEQVLMQFEEHVKTTKPPNLRDPGLLAHTIVTGLQIYFDRSCGMSLLYRFERPQYADIRKRYITGPQVKIEEAVEMSAVYGAEHLLRMLVSLPQMIANSSMDAESVGLVRDYVNELLKFMEAEKDRIFQREYDTPSEAYGNTARS